MGIGVYMMYIYIYVYIYIYIYIDSAISIINTITITIKECGSAPGQPKKLEAPLGRPSGGAATPSSC